MNTSYKITSRSIGLAALLLTTVLTGCSKDNNNGGSGSGSGSGTEPKVMATTPAESDVAVALNSKVIATFSETMDAANIDTVSFTVVGAVEPALSGSVSLDAATIAASFTPGSAFTASTRYTATLTTLVKSPAGNALASNYV